VCILEGEHQCANLVRFKDIARKSSPPRRGDYFTFPRINRWLIGYLGTSWSASTSKNEDEQRPNAAVRLRNDGRVGLQIRDPWCDHTRGPGLAALTAIASL